MVKIFVPHISTRLKKFFDYHKIVIDMMFKIIKLKKPHIINAYAYYTKNPPKNDNETIILKIPKGIKQKR